MSNTRTDRDLERDFDGTFPGSSNSDFDRPKPKPYKPRTGRAGLAQADRIDAGEQRKKIERASHAGIETVPRETLDASRDALHAIRVEKFGLKNGQSAVDTAVEVEPVAEPQYPAVEPGDQAKLFE